MDHLVQQFIVRYLVIVNLIFIILKLFDTYFSIKILKNSNSLLNSIVNNNNKLTNNTYYTFTSFRFFKKSLSILVSSILLLQVVL